MSFGDQAMGESPYRFAPMTRLLLQHVARRMVIAVWGLLEVLAGDHFSRVAFALMIPLGLAITRQLRISSVDRISADVVEPLVEASWRSAVRTLTELPLALVFMILGLFEPVLGAYGGGALGVAAVQLYLLYRAVRYERVEGGRLYVHEPRQLLGRQTSGGLVLATPPACRACRP